MVDIAIPGNDDAMRAIELVLKEIGDAVIEGKSGRQTREETDKGDNNNRRGERGGRRRTTSAMAEEAAAAEKPQPIEEPAAADVPAASVFERYWLIDNLKRAVERPLSLFLRGMALELLVISIFRG